ncbi:MAG: hypothetical protein HY893_06385 [Deltaproteobacteria bacterium]|nr:hypothetical protein [Deltaproteobacteria bacterium]
MTNESFPRYRRRRYLINKGLQTRFIIGFSLAVFLGFILNLLFVYFLIDRELTRELYKIHIKIRTTSEIAAPILWQLGAVTVPVILIASAVLGYYLTRRVEVPLVSFRKAIRRAGLGDLTGTLGDDFTGGLSKAFNKVSASLEKRFRALKGSVEGLEGRCAELSASIEGRVSKADALKALKELGEARESVRRELSGFKV